MGFPVAPDGTKWFVGKGRVYFNRLVEGKATYERFLGNTPKFELGSNPDELKGNSSADKAAGLVIKIVVRPNWFFSIDCNELTKENLAAMLMADEGTVLDQSAATIATPEVFTDVVQGGFYALANRKVYDVIVTDGGQSPTTYTEGEDYDVDQLSGRIRITPGGDISKTTPGDISVTYKCDDDASPYAEASAQSSVEGLLRFISDNMNGPNYEILAWKVSLTHDGNLALIQDDFGVFTLKADIMDDSANHTKTDTQPFGPYFHVIDNSVAWTEPQTP